MLAMYHILLAFIIFAWFQRLYLTLTFFGGEFVAVFG